MDMKTWESAEDSFCDLVQQIERIAKAEPDGYDWMDVGEAAQRSYEALCGEQIEKCSLLDELIDATAAAAADSVENAMARMLGVDQAALGCVLAHWTEDKTNAPISSSELLERIENYKKWLSRIRRPPAHHPAPQSP